MDILHSVYQRCMKISSGEDINQFSDSFICAFQRVLAKHLDLSDVLYMIISTLLFHFGNWIAKEKRNKVKVTSSPDHDIVFLTLLSHTKKSKLIAMKVNWFTVVLC